MGNTPGQDDGTQLKGVFHHGGKAGHNSQRDGRISEHCPDEEAARGAAEKLIGGRNPKS